MLHTHYKGGREYKLFMFFLRLISVSLYTITVEAESL